MSSKIYFFLIGVCLFLLHACTNRAGREPETFDVVQTDNLEPSVFINRVDYFSTGDLYTEISLKQSAGNTSDLYDFLAKSADSIIYNDDEIKRSRLSFPVAEEYFDLTGLKEINLFNERGSRVGSASFVRVEFVEDLIITRFVAVFNERNKAKSPRYCISSPMPEIVDDFQLQKSKSAMAPILKKRVPEDESQSVQYDTTFKINAFKSPYSFVSIDTVSYIVENASDHLLYQSTDPENFIEVIPVCFQQNDKPVFIVTSAAPETDFFWTTLMSFNGTSCVANPGNRIRLTKPAQ